MHSKWKSLCWPVSAVSGIAMLSVLSVAQAATIDSWNKNNVVTDLPNWPPGVEPSHVPGVTYDSKLYTDVTKLESNGTVIWKEGAVIAPGATVLTESPGVGDNCIITSGTNRAIPGSIPKTCTDEFQSAKRVKLEARAAGTGSLDPNGIMLTDGKPLDMVFNASNADDVARAYRVFKKYINATGQRMDGFVVELGFGTGSNFTPSADNDGLKFTKRQKGQNPNIQDFDPLPFYSTPPGDSDLGSFMSAGLFGDAAFNNNRTIDGYFGLPDGVEPWTGTCNLDPIGEGRAYYNLVVQNEDRIETVGDVQGLHYCLFGNMLPQGELPLGFFWDPDGDPVTDADTIADWDGSGESPACGGTPCWETYVVLDTDPASDTYGDPVLDVEGNFTRPANPPVAVPQHVIDFWVANPEPEVIDLTNPVQFYFITELDDMGLVNNNYHITVESVSNWPTYDPITGAATFTMRTSNVGEGVAFDAPWLATLPPELADDPLSSDVTVALSVAGSVDEGTEVPLGVTVTTASGQPAASGQVVGEAVDPVTGKAVASFYGEFADLAPGASQAFTFDWLVSDPTGLPENVIWTTTAYLDGGDLNEDDNTDQVAVSINAAPVVDVSISEFEVPRHVKSGKTEDAKVKIFLSNDSEQPASGTVSVEVEGAVIFSADFVDLRIGESEEFEFKWTAPVVTRRTDVITVATVSVTGDTDLSNNTAVGTTKVTPGR